MKLLFFFLLGYSRFSFREEDRVGILNFFLRSGIVNHMGKDRAGNPCFLIFSRDKAAPGELPCTHISDHGLPALGRRLLQRPGMVAGSLLGVLLLVLSSLFVWRVEVTGNESIPDSRLIAILGEEGIGIGAFTPKIDTAKAKTALLLHDPTLSFASVYVRGTTLYLEVRESDSPPKTEEENQGYANQVAAYDAIIEQIGVKSGRSVVRVGETVKAGDLLISGVYDSALGLRAVYAEGEVMGRVGRRFEVKQPYIIEEKTVKEQKNSAVSLLFFGKELNLFNSTGNYGEEYDIIKRKEQIILFGKIQLPIFLEYESVLSYTVKERKLTEEEAVKAAHRAMSSLISGELANGMLLYTGFEGDFTEEGYVLSCYAEALLDIASPRAFSLEQP